MIRAVRHIVATVTAVRFALSARRDLLLELLALRHQVAVLARSNRLCFANTPITLRMSSNYHVES